jgi:hypothetical protein
MYKLFVFCCLLHYVLGRAVDTCDLAAVFGSQELRNVPGFLTLYSIPLPAEFFSQNEDILISVRSTPLRCYLRKKIDINVKRRKVMSDRLTFSWFVGTCNLGHPVTGPQEALWNTVKW